MLTNSSTLSGRRVLVPGGTGLVGSGVVLRYLAAGADVVVPTRTAARAAAFRAALGDRVTDRLHLVVHDYTTFAGAEDLAAQMVENLGRIDDVVAPIGGWWAGKRLWEIDEDDWASAFVGLATTHMAVLRAALPRMSATGAYTLIVGDSAEFPVPTSGLVSMEQAAILMMRRVVAVEAGSEKRVFALTLGPVGQGPGDGGVTADQVGQVAVAASRSLVEGRELPLHGPEEVAGAIALLDGTAASTSLSSPDPGSPAAHAA